MRIQHNIMAMSAYRNYTNNVSAMQKNLEKLSSGYKINRAGDDAAGLAISEKMRAQITGLETAQKNAKDGISLVKTAEGALTEVHDMLNRMVELATQSSNGTYDDKTDRNQMQKEVNQLLEEINRIADSSNFNGINLLDGTLGLNTDAFGISAADPVDVTDTAVDISDALAAEDAGYSSVHLETAAVAAATPGFKINLGSLAIANPSAGDKITITAAGNSYELTLAADDTTATKIADKLIAAMKADGAPNGVKADGTAATGAAATAVKIGNAAYTIGANNAGEITFTYAGRYTDPNDLTTFVANATFDGTEEEAKAINNALGFAVEASDITGDGVKSGHPVHDATNVTQATAAVTAGMAGIDLTLNSDIVANGNTLEIDGQKFQFKTSATGFTAVNGATVIDLTTAKTDEERIHMAADKLSQQGEITGAEAGRKWTIGVENGTIIHFEQTAAANDTTKLLDTYDKLTDMIKVNGPATTKTYNATKITIKDASKISEDNTISVGDKKYVFTNDTEKAGTTEGKTSYINVSDGAQGLVDAINAGKTGAAAIASLDSSGNVIVRASAEKENAPTILGKGLTLQIGDTSDPWNQLNVAVQDMHASSLGIEGLDIKTEATAQAAIDKIKAAINTVSDVRGTLGATQNRLDHTINNLSVMTENIQDAESTIRDVDVAEEMMAYTKNNILIQSAQAMLAQANQVPQGVLQLLG